MPPKAGKVDSGVTAKLALRWRAVDGPAASQLVGIDQVPPWLRFNRFILSGYRPQLGMPAAAKTLLRWHNETVNVWTHLLPALGCAYMLIAPPVDVWTMQWTLASFIFIFGASVIYHLFMPCCRSDDDYARLISCDVVGALTCVTMSAYSFIHYGYRCTPEATRTNVGTLFGISAAFLALAIFTFRMSVAQRFRAFGVHCIVRLLLCQYIMFPKVLRFGFTRSYVYHTTSFFVILLGGLFNVSRVPERWLPVTSRWIDFIGNSHNWWHLMCIGSGALTILGAVYDIVEYEETSC
jgi:adiponectin receptor